MSRRFQFPVRKAFSCLIAVLCVTTVFLTEAQTAGTIPRIGYLAAGCDRDHPCPLLDAFRQGLRELGYDEGKNILLEARYGEGNRELVLSFVAELVQLKVDILVVTSLTSIQAAKQATQTIPIVMVTVQDPVDTGIVESLAHPGGNITGVTTIARELSGKRLELLQEMVPRLSRVGALWDASAPGAKIGFKEYESAARGLKIQLQSLAVRGPNPDLAGAFQTAAKGRAGGIITIGNPLLGRFQKQIAELAVQHRKPMMCERSDYVEAGCLVSYSTNQPDQYRRAATYVDKILRGRMPEDLPVEQPMKFDFVVNLKTAKQINVTIPPNVLVRATRVIR